MFGPQGELIEEPKKKLTARFVSEIRCAMARKHGIRITPAEARKAILEAEKRRLK